MPLSNDNLNVGLPRSPEPRRRWSVGDRVFALWDPVWCYPGTVGEVKDDSVFVFFDDGDRGWLSPDKVRPLLIAEDSRVFCRSRGMAFAPAVVKYRNGEQLIIQYEDGAMEWTVTATLRVHRNYNGQREEPPSQAITTATHLAALESSRPSVSAGQNQVWAGEAMPLREGDRVLANEGGGWLYPGVIEEVRPGEFLVLFDSGKRASVPAARVRRLHIDVGSRVFCRWMGGPTYYSGTVKERNGEMIFIHYDDGDREWNTIGLTRVPANAGTAFYGGTISLLMGRFGCLIWLPIIVGIYILFRMMR